MEAAVLCEKLGWTYQQYLEQPADFIHTLIAMLNAREIATEEKRREAEAKART